MEPETPLFHGSHVSMAPSGNVLLHGPDVSWGPAARRGEPGLSLHHGHGKPGQPTSGAQAEGAAQVSPDGHRCHDILGRGGIA